MTIYFDSNKKAYGFEIENYIATTTDELWMQVCTDNNAWDIVDGQFIDKRTSPEYIEIQLQKAKELKYNEANVGAKAYIDEGRALYELTPTRHIEATDGNIGKFSAYALGYVTGEITGTVTWNTKEDENIELNQTEVQQILTGLGLIQAQVWTVKFPYYKNLINNATTVEEVEAIVIDYDSDLFNE